MDEYSMTILDPDAGVTSAAHSPPPQEDYQEMACFELYQNISLNGKFCSPAWDSFFCWPPTLSGLNVTKPCPLHDDFGRYIGDSTDPDLVAFRVCQRNGEWLDNKTNFSICIKNIHDLHPISSTPTIVAYIIIVCSVISLVTLSLALFIFCYFKCLQCCRLRVHRNLSVALMIHLTLLIVSSSPTIVEVSYRDMDWLCKGVLGFQMYSAMASTNWMFVEGLLLHSRVTISIFKQDAPFKLYYCIGWGLPGVFIATWSFIMTQMLATPCWEGYGDTSYIWLITGPMMAALLVNTIFLINIIRVLMTKHHANVTVETTQVRKAIKATALLFPLLGITHLLFCINPKGDGKLEEAYMIINAFIKSSQGLFVAVLYCFMNSDVQTALRNAYLRSVIRRNPNHRYQRGRGMSQTSATYVSHSDGMLLDTARQKNSSRAILRLQDVQPPPRHCLSVLDIKGDNKTKIECSTMF